MAGEPARPAPRRAVLGQGPAVHHGACRTTMGSLIFADQVPAEDAVPVRRLREAGAILVGKTTTPEFGHKPLTDSPLFGATRNPWDLSRTAGGSSGGAAAAVASGQGPLASAPTAAARSASPPPAAASSASSPRSGACRTCTRPISSPRPPTSARWRGRVARRAACFDAIVGFDAGDPYSRPEPADDPRDVAVRGLRIGWLPRVGNRLVDAEVLAACEAAVRHLEGRGADVETLDEDVSAFERPSWSACRAGWPRASARTWRSSATRSRRACASPIERGARWSAVDWVNALGQRTAMYRRVNALFRRFDFLLLADPRPGPRSPSITTRSSRSRSRARTPARSAAPGIPISGPSTSRATRRSRCRAGGPPTGCPSGCRSSAPGTPTAACSPWPATSSASGRARARCPLLTASPHSGDTPCRSRPRASRSC